MFWSRKQGLIGVDMGAGAVKIAQVARNRTGLELVGAAIVRRQTPWTAEVLGQKPLPTSADEIQGGLSLAGTLAGRQAACVISPAACQLHRVQAPSANPSPDQILRELTKVATFREKQVFDSWPLDHPTEKSREAGQRGVVSMPLSLANRVAGDLAAARLQCDCVDGIPTATARAMRLMFGKQKKVVAAIDCGFTEARFTSIFQGRPLYVRPLKRTGFAETLESLTDLLGCSSDEALGLVNTQGLLGTKPSSDSSGGPSASAQLVHDLLMPMVDRVVSEVKRTLDYLVARRRSALPVCLVLLGAGGTIRGLERHLTERLDLAIRLWSPDPKILTCPADLSVPLPLLAPAIAASILPWEAP